MSRQHTEARNGTEPGMEGSVGHDEVGYPAAAKPWDGWMRGRQ